jgi:hypothetical protein
MWDTAGAGDPRTATVERQGDRGEAEAMSLPTTCVCGRKVRPGERCVCGQGRKANGRRMREQPWRKAYEVTSYRKNKALRYVMVGGVCENCGAALKGPLHPMGVAWQCHHHIEAARFAIPDTANAIENLRCYCTKCHAGRRKPK